MHSQDRFSPPENWHYQSFTSYSGKQIRYGHAEPVGEKIGTVVMTTGYADFMEVYHETMHDYLDRGYAVWMMDWAGQGGSDKNSPKTMRIEEHLTDLKKFRHSVIQDIQDKPIILSSHSMGGLISLHYLQRQQGDFNFAILATPLVKSAMNPIARCFVKELFNVAVHLGFGHHTAKNRKAVINELKAERESIRKENPVRMDLHKKFVKANKGLIAEEPCISMVSSLFSLAETIRDEKLLKSIHTPILLFAAGRDGVIDNTAIKRAGELLPNGQHIFIDDAIHNIWLERPHIRQELWNHIDNFLTAQHRNFDTQAKNIPPRKTAPPQP